MRIVTRLRKNTLALAFVIIALFGFASIYAAFATSSPDWSIRALMAIVGMSALSLAVILLRIWNPVSRNGPQRK
jgi:hypothetical protein